MKPLLRFGLAATFLASGASGYYHFTHFLTRVGPFRPIPEKFDLNVLPARTLTYFIGDASGVQLASGDSYAALTSQIRSAASAWDNAESSDLRLAYGGITSPGASQSAPSTEILFLAEVPPGLVAMGGPTVRADSNGSFVPILKSVVIIRPDLRDRPSYTESMFSTLVHEFGHALGLQHTLTSSVMSTATTRATSKAHPLSADDVASISVLYPRAGFSQNTGTITGRVTMGSQPVNLASVVAIAPNGVVVSALTNPDGTYRIEGLPPRAYYVYVHPLPPPREGQATPADIVYPLDPDNRTFPVGAPFETVFYTPGGGVKDFVQATIVATPAGVPTENINFNVRQRNGYSIHSVETYAFPGGTAVKPPYLSPNMTNPFVVATGSGLISGNGPVPGLRATVLGGADLLIRPYAVAASSYLQLDVDPRTLAVPSNTQRHVIFSANNDIYVLPAAFFHVDRPPPQITGLVPQNDGAVRTLVVLGTNLSADTVINLDGVPAPVRSFDDAGSGSGRVTVVLPPGPPGYRAVVTALNSDGQSSLFVQNDNPPTYTYPADLATATQAAVLPGSTGLPAGTESLVQIDGLNTNFVDGQVTVGFGTSDIIVRRVWVSSPTRLMVNVAVSAAAQPGTVNLTIVSGLQVVSQPFAFSVQPPQARPFWLMSGISNFVTGQPSVSAGSLATVQVGAAPVPLSTGNVTILLNDLRIPALGVTGNQITFQIPQNISSGFATVRVEASGERSAPTGVNIDPPPPRILSATLASAESRNARRGDVLVLAVSNLNAAGAHVTVQIGTRNGQVVQVTGDSDKQSVVVQVPADSPTGEGVPVTVSADARTSDPVNITITN